MSGPSGRIEAWLLVTLVTLVHLDTAEGTGGDARPSRRNPARFFPVPVWKFMAVSGREGSFDLNRPQFRCSDDRLWVRLSLVRHSKARLTNGIRLLALPDSSSASVRRFGPVLLLKLPYDSAHLQLAVANGRRFHQLQVFYFDSLLQTNMVALASCEDLATDLHPPPPLMLCKPSQILVQLPSGSKVLKIKNICDGAPIRSAVSMVRAGSVFVLNSTAAHTYSMVVYLDSLGEMSTMLAACDNADTQRPHKVQPRSLRDEVDSDSRAAAEELQCSTTAAPISVFYRDSLIFELWGYDEIPSGEYNEDDTADTTGDLAPTRSSTMSATTLRPCATTTSPSPAPACESHTDATTPTSSVAPTTRKISALTPTPGSRTSEAAPICATMTPPATPRAPTSATPTSTSAVPGGVFRFDAPLSMSAAMPTTTSPPTTTTPTAPVTTPSSASSSFVSTATEPATAGAPTEVYTSKEPTTTSSAPAGAVPATPSTTVAVTAAESRRTTTLLVPTARPTIAYPVLPKPPPTSATTSSSPTSNSSLTPTSTGTTTVAASRELSDSMMPTLASPPTTMTTSGSISTVMKVSRTLSISKSPELGTTTFTMATTRGVPTPIPATRATTISSVPTTSSASLMTYWTMTMTTAAPTTTSSLPSMTTLVPTTNMFPLTSAKTSSVVPATTQANVSVSSSTSLKRVGSQGLSQTIPMSAPTIQYPPFTTTDALTRSTAVLPGSGAPVRNITLALAAIPTPPSSLVMATASAPITSPVPKTIAGHSMTMSTSPELVTTFDLTTSTAVPNRTSSAAINAAAPTGNHEPTTTLGPSHTTSVSTVGSRIMNATIHTTAFATAPLSTLSKTTRSPITNPIHAVVPMTQITSTMTTRTNPAQTSPLAKTTPTLTSAINKSNTAPASTTLSPTMSTPLPTSNRAKTSSTAGRGVSQDTISTSQTTSSGPTTSAWRATAKMPPNAIALTLSTMPSATSARHSHAVHTTPLASTTAFRVPPVLDTVSASTATSAVPMTPAFVTRKSLTPGIAKKLPTPTVKTSLAQTTTMPTTRLPPMVNTFAQTPVPTTTYDTTATATERLSTTHPPTIIGAVSPSSTTMPNFAPSKSPSPTTTSVPSQTKTSTAVPTPTTAEIPTTTSTSSFAVPATPPARTTRSPNPSSVPTATSALTSTIPETVTTATSTTLSTAAVTALAPGPKTNVALPSSGTTTSTFSTNTIPTTVTSDPVTIPVPKTSRTPTSTVPGPIDVTSTTLSAIKLTTSHSGSTIPSQAQTATSPVSASIVGTIGLSQTTAVGLGTAPSGSAAPFQATFISLMSTTSRTNSAFTATVGSTSSPSQTTAILSTGSNSAMKNLSLAPTTSPVSTSGPTSRLTASAIPSPSQTISAVSTLKTAGDLRPTTAILSTPSPSETTIPSIIFSVPPTSRTSSSPTTAVLSTTAALATSLPQVSTTTAPGTVTAMTTSPGVETLVTSIGINPYRARMTLQGTKPPPGPQTPSSAMKAKLETSSPAQTTAILSTRAASQAGITTSPVIATSGTTSPGSGALTSSLAQTTPIRAIMSTFLMTTSPVTKKPRKSSLVTQMVGTPRRVPLCFKQHSLQIKHLFQLLGVRNIAGATKTQDSAEVIVPAVQKLPPNC
ncbi:mucin-2-like [Hippocampus zosterae]|uniref:mucin-2-like n=1 Tax=Hippocampus zosterae TaxID=109293 RepID=UPI00223CDF78|nr:mucin-2-like [Hippocampus zosterae]